METHKISAKYRYFTQYPVQISNSLIEFAAWMALSYTKLERYGFSILKKKGDPSKWPKNR